MRLKSAPLIVRATPRGPTSTTVFGSVATIASGVGRPPVSTGVQVWPELPVLRSSPAVFTAKPTVSVGNVTSVMSSDVATFGFVQSSPPLVVRARLPLSPVAKTARDEVARRRVSVAVRTEPTGAQFAPPFAEMTVAPAAPTAVAALAVLKAAARILLVDGFTDVQLAPPSSVRSSWSPWRLAARQRVALAQRIFVRSAAGTSSGTVC